MTMRRSICQQDCEVPFKLNPTFCQSCYNGKESAPKAAPAPAAPTSPELSPREAAIVRAIAELLVLMR